MTTSQLIDKLRSLADVGIVNAKEDTQTLREAADRLFALRAKADSRWDEWLIVEDVLALAEINADGETEMTNMKADAVSFDSRKDCEEFIEKFRDQLIDAVPMLRGDWEPGGFNFLFTDY